MGNCEGKYTIKDVSAIVGIQPGTLRAWERRYKMIAPARNESGHRLYTDEHLKTLRFLVSKVDLGYTISQAISIMDQAHMDNGEGQTHKKIINNLSDELLAALMDFNQSRAKELMNQSFGLYTIDKAVSEIISPVLVKVGDLWEEGSITTAHEHFASSFLRSKIEGFSHTFLPHASLPKAIAVCGPGEGHEIGLQVFTLFLRRRGLEVIYLGTSIAEQDLETVILKVNPGFLFFSCTLGPSAAAVLENSEEIAMQFPQLCIGFGGKAFEGIPSTQLERYKENLVGSTWIEWEKWLKRRIDGLK